MIGLYEVVLIAGKVIGLVLFLAIFSLLFDYAMFRLLMAGEGD